MRMFFFLDVFLVERVIAKKICAFIFNRLTIGKKLLKLSLNIKIIKYLVGILLIHLQNVN